ncbi:MAG TPA: RHS repeat-associated core domain-containing protein [Tepidisphaeraceae bacterium]|jgi:RHS repeat-associated protein|nr:RHS repeat-associated core domain-containing protein [Tepidisphaeraceae bacterium]
MNRRKRQKSRAALFESLEPRIVLGYFSADPIDETPPPVPPTCCPNPPTVGPSANTGQGPPATTQQPVRDFDGTPVIFTADLQTSSSALGLPWGMTRSWSGMNNSGPVGNGWVVGEMPYIVVAGGTDGSPEPGAPPASDGNGILTGTDADNRLEVVEGGTSVLTFSVQGSGSGITYVPWEGQPIKLELAPDPTPVLRLTDAQGNVTEFYDVNRDGGGNPVATSRMAGGVPQGYGRFKDYTSADGTTRIDATYDTSGYLTGEVLSDSATGDSEQIAYSYSTVTNDLVTAAGGVAAQLVSTATLERPDGSGGWLPVQRAVYTYYTGRVSNGSGGWTNDPNGRLGDLQLVQTENATGPVASPTWQVINTDYYRYDKLTGESDNIASQGPTNDAATTGGPDPIQPAGTYNASSPSYLDDFTLSGLKTVVGGQAFAQMAAAVPGYLTATDSALQPYVNNYFQYERWADHVGADGNPSFGSSYWNNNNDYDWRVGYRLGTRYRVTDEIAQGAGCSCTSSGQGEYKYEYAANYSGYVDGGDPSTGIGYNSIEYNTWRMRTTEFLPKDDTTWGDHDRQVVYTDEVGLPVLDDFIQVAGTSSSVTDMTVSATTGSGATIDVTDPGHGFNTGDRVAITGVLPELYDGVFTVTRIDANTFSFVLPYNYFGSSGAPQPYVNQTVNGSSIATTATKVTGEWLTYYRYDDQGRLIMEADPSAVSGYDDSTLDLVNSVGGNAQYLNDTSGLISTTTYSGTTTATATTAGDAAGYVSASYVQQGELGTPIIQESKSYYAHTAGGVTVYPEAADTVYGLDSGTASDYSDRDPRTTSYAYTWFSGTNQVQSMAVSSPVVASAQDGPGTADIATTVYDAYGRPTWTKDGDGFINYTAYDPATGAVVETITDVDTTQTSDFSNLPSGWSTPSGGGLNLVTRYEVDGLGRTTKETDPNGNVTYTVYDDPDHEVRVYRGWNAATGMPTGPTEVTREDWTGGYTETLAMSATPHTTDGVPDGTEAISGIQSLSRDLLDYSGRVVETDQYFSLSGVSYSAASLRLGTAGTNYYATTYGYDDRGRMNRVMDAVGTITTTVFDGLGRPVATYVGTNDGWVPGLTGPSNMVLTSENQYDNGGVGDGNLTRTIQYPDGNTADARETDYTYDWRDRVSRAKLGVQSSESDGVNRPLLTYETDNLGEVTAVSQYAGDMVPIGTTPLSTSLLRARTVIKYDDQGRPYQVLQYDVSQPTDPVYSPGHVSSTALTTSTYYDHRGDVIATFAPGGLVTKDQYDGAGRLVSRSQTDGAGGSTWSAAVSLAGDHVLNQVLTTYDGDGNPILVTTKDRFHDDTSSDTGALGDVNTGPKARVSYAASYYDAADRITASVDVGTNGGTAYTRPASPPARSDTALVTGYSYNSAGWVQDATDPRGIVARTSYDLLGRTVETIAGYNAGVNGGLPTASANQTTDTTYDGLGHALTVTAVMPSGTPSQTTKYVYGVTTAGGSAVTSNDLLATLEYPDPTTGSPSTSSSNQETYTYDALGEITGMTDPNGTTHAYTYDVLGRQIDDAVTALGTGVDGAVRRIETAYDSAGNAYLFTSYDAASGGHIVNQVERIYNGLGQLTGEYQEHSGGVNTSITPEVRYAYAEMAGGQDNSRLVSTTYPNGRVVDDVYNSGLDAAISRVSALADDASGSPGTLLETYQYLGLATIVDRGHPEPGVDLSYIQQAGDPNANADGGDQYTGLDRFGRVIDQNWVNTGTGTSAVRYQYGYDRAGDRLYQADLVDAALSELYHANSTLTGDANTAYDALGRLTGFARGVLSASGNNGTQLDSVASSSQAQSWQLDALGNQTSVTTDGTTTTRAFNAQNQETGVSGPTNLPSVPTFDGNGNTTADAGQTMVYDAWNRLVAVKAAGVGTVLETYAYDALGRRIEETNTPAATVVAPGVASTVAFVDDLEAGYTEAGTWSGGGGGGANGEYRYAAAGSGTTQATWTNTGLAAGNYDVQVTWVAYSNRADNAHYLIYDGTTLVKEARLNQQLAPSGPSYGGVNYQDLGTVAVSSGTLKVVLANDADGYVIADAVRVLATTSPASFSDDLEVGYTETGTWSGAGGGSDGDGEYRYAAGTNSSSVTATATWQSSSVAAGTYDVQVTWAAYSNRADNANYLIYDGTTLIKEIRINQQLAPSGPSYGGVTYQDLGPVSVSSGTLKIVLQNNADNYVIADAVRVLRPLNPAPFTDDLEAGYSETGTWTDAGGGADGEGRFAAGTGTSTATATAAWQSTGLVTGNYDVQVTWVAFSNRATNAHYRIYDGTNLVADLTVNQQSAPSGASYGGVTYQDLGTVLITSGTLRVVLSNDANGYVYADGVRILPASTTDHLYYSSQWQVLEERRGGTAASDVSDQYVWSQAYVDALVLRDRFAGGVLIQRLYALQDANWDTAAIIDTFGTVQERYVYDPYGAVTVLDASGAARTTNVSAFGWQYLHQGGRLDAVTGWYSFRHRDLIPSEGRWAERDPMGFDAGDVNLYRFVSDSPLTFTDSRGLAQPLHRTHGGGKLDRPLPKDVNPNWQFDKDPSCRKLEQARNEVEQSILQRESELGPEGIDPRFPEHDAAIREEEEYLEKIEQALADCNKKKYSKPPGSNCSMRAPNSQDPWWVGQPYIPTLPKFLQPAEPGFLLPQTPSPQVCEVPGPVKGPGIPRVTPRPVPRPIRSPVRR